jgi:hypothetical protein
LELGLYFPSEYVLSHFSSRPDHSLFEFKFIFSLSKLVNHFLELFILTFFSSIFCFCFQARKSFFDSLFLSAFLLFKIEEKNLRN